MAGGVFIPNFKKGRLKKVFLLLKMTMQKKMLEQSIDRVTLKRTNGRRSRYFGKDKTVYLAKNAGSDTLAHELFHEIDVTYGLTANGLLKDSVRLDYRRLQNLSKGYGKSIQEMLYLKYPEAFETNTAGMRLKEMYRGISDIIHGLSNGDIFFGYGHKATGYWQKEKAIEKETFAQYGRTVYNGNKDVIRMFQEIFPESWKEISDTLERMIK